MNKKQYLAIILYALAMLIVISWLLLCSFDGFVKLPSKGFKATEIQSLPEFLRPIYEGSPNLITLICYIMFTLSAFLFLKEKIVWRRFVSISSFIMLAWLFICLA
jgi:hypothetical protein